MGNDHQSDAPATAVPAFEDHALEPVPESSRKGLLQLVMVQIGWNISVSAFLVGGTIGAGTRFGTALLAILLANLFLAGVALLAGAVGYRTGLTSYLISRVVFGVQGSVVVSLVLGILAMGFIGVLMDAWGTSINRLLPAVPWTVVVLLFAAAITSTAIYGFKGLARFTSIAVPFEIAIALFALVSIVTREGGFADVLDATPAAPISFSVAMGAAIATWITGATLVPDVARYARSIKDVAIASVVGFVVGAGVFETVATVSAMKVGNPNFAAVMDTLGLLAPAVVMLVLALWNTADNNLYSSSLAFSNVSRIFGVRIPRAVWTVVSVLIAVAVAFAGFASRFLSFLNIVAVVTPPFAGVVISHFYLLGRSRRSGAELLAEAPKVRVVALVSWLAASLIAYNVDWFVKPINGLVLGALIYTGLSWVSSLVTAGRSGDAAEAEPAAGAAVDRRS
jgi:cytosine permease